MKRCVCVLMVLALLLCGCGGTKEPERQRYTATFLTLFDTVTTIVGFANSQEEFTATAQAIHDELLEYHQLFDIYNDYEGIVNLKAVNEQAATAPVAVDQRIMELLLCGKDWYEATGGKVNIAMGSVLLLWHEARNDGINDPANAYLPEEAALREASLHTNPENLILDTEKGTIFFADPGLRLDVGAVAKGWAVQKVCQNAPAGLLVSVGGNVYATGPKNENGDSWGVGIQNPNGGDDHLHILSVTGGSVVTSGDYQRAYIVDGELYHHIIDPDTLYPSIYWRSVTIVNGDSGVGDMLSTALFLLPQEAGLALLEQYNAEAMWVDREGNRYYSPGFEVLIRS